MMSPATNACGLKLQVHEALSVIEEEETYELAVEEVELNIYV